MRFLDLDGIGTTANSTAADLDLPSGSVVLFAKLVWGGRRDAGTGRRRRGCQLRPGQVARAGRRGLHDGDLDRTGGDPASGTDGHPYQASIDVTSQVAAAGNGTYWVADIQAATGSDRYAGLVAGGRLPQPSLPLRDLAVYEGFADVTTSAATSTVTIPVTGFLTPATGTVNASVGFVAWEGDRGLTGEQVLLNGTQLRRCVPPATNFFNSGITDAAPT
jgi:hypothetical protein